MIPAAQRAGRAAASTPACAPAAPSRRSCSAAPRSAWRLPPPTPSSAVGVDRTGLLLPSSVTQDDAIAALVILGGAAVLTLSLVLLAIWAARQSSRARMSFVRGLLGLVAIVVAGVAAGALVWTANAGSTAGHQRA